MRGVSGPGPAAGSGITWYDILGVLPSVSVSKIQREYDAKASLLRPELISGAPSAVVKAASRAQGILDAAWRVLRDPVNRELYDEEIGFRRSGEGLASRVSFPSEPGWGPADFSFAGGWRAAGLLGAAHWTPAHSNRRRFDCRVRARPSGQILLFLCALVIPGRSNRHSSFSNHRRPRTARFNDPDG